MQPWIFYAILSAVFASFVAIFGKIGISKVDSTLATTVRAIIMAGFLLTASLALGKFNLIKTIDNKALLFIALSGIVGAISWIFYFIALKSGPTSAVSAIDKTSIVFVFIFAIIFLSEKFTWLKALGAILVGVGAVVMAL
jgi:transporter family protein